MMFEWFWRVRRADEHIWRSARTPVLQCGLDDDIIDQAPLARSGGGVEVGAGRAG